MNNKPARGQSETPVDPSDPWSPKRPFGPGSVSIAIALLLLLGISFHRQGLDQSLVRTPEAADQAWTFIDRALPPRIEEAQRVERLKQLGEMPDADSLPMLARIERRPLNPIQPHAGTADFLVEPLGYLRRCVILMLGTIEMAFWGTLVAMTLSLPLGIIGARTMAYGKIPYSIGRGLSSLSRATPELILALILALMYGFGPTAGILALGLHSAGFLGKFLADDIENTDRGPRDALASTGASKLKVLRIAIVPQVLPQYVAYLQYILERNVRTASVLGIVGVGGIGLELKFAYDNGEFDKVSTVLIVIFATVLTLELISQRIRQRIIR